MPDLVAQGAEPEHRWRRAVSPGETVLVGRAAGVWSTPWDERISRRHVSIRTHGRQIHVSVLPEARNPVFFRGRKVDRFTVAPGEHFVIGGTTFSLADEHAAATLDAPAPVSQHTFESHELRRASFRDPDSRIAAIARLPEILSGSSTDEELFVRLVTLLLSGIVSSKAAALVRVTDDDRIDVMHWDRRMIVGSDFHPSEQLIRQSVAAAESVVHVWTASPGAAAHQFTMSEGIDWAFCTPIRNPCCRNWAIYVTGGFPTDQGVKMSPRWLQDDVKFAELTASTFAGLREAQLVTRRHAGLRRFLSPVVLEAIAGSDPDDVLSPREADVTVLFCDLRGFTRHSEQSGHDLIGLLNRVSRALGVMTRHILAQGGVIGDFHGDSAMGFWGWPLAQEDAAERACRAALGIRREFEAGLGDASESPEQEFRAGIGIAGGRAVAGRIGTIDQVKVTVFGPVVNLASRLESMTKRLSASILLDETTAHAIRSRLPREEGRLRRVAKVRPFGLNTPLETSELLPPAAEPGALADEDIAAYETALDALQSGDWKRALQLLHRVPADDQVKDFLTVFIAEHGRTPPPGWDGVITLREK